MGCRKVAAEVVDLEAADGADGQRRLAVVVVFGRRRQRGRRRAELGSCRGRRHVAGRHRVLKSKS